MTSVPPWAGGGRKTGKLLFLKSVVFTFHFLGGPGTMMTIINDYDDADNDSNDDGDDG